MNVKTVVQLLILFVIIFFLYFFIKNTFFTDDVKVANVDLGEKEKNTLEITNSEKESEESNIIKNLSYKSIDEGGNQYILNAESGEKVENKNFLKLYKVRAQIKLVDKSIILINSDFANYDSITFETNFYQNINGSFEDNRFLSENLDLLFKDNKAIMYNNIKFYNKTIDANADEIVFDLLNGNVNINMFDKNEKIIIKKE
tara:strand:- start:112 stop:714 length:603 start_codon:yes stop_codon:yes gene_type:complete